MKEAEALARLQELHRLVRALPAERARLVETLYECGLTLAEIGRAVDPPVTRARVSQWRAMGVSTAVRPAEGGSA